MRQLGALLAATVALASATGSTGAQTEVELRASTMEYRFVDFSHTRESGLVVDALYVGVAGLNELLLGAGYELELPRGWSLTPVLYAATGDDGRGLALGGLVSLDREKGRIQGFIGHFFRTSGDASDSTFLDGLDVTRVFGRWEVGGSADAYRTGRELTWLVGPTLKRNDSLGAWALSARSGSATEFRLSRKFAF